MRFKSLSEVKRATPYEVALAVLPQEIPMAHYAMAKAFKINELVRTIHKESLEWYGYTIANRDHPELIVDIGLPANEKNIHHYTSVGPEEIANYQKSLKPDTVINGWIHSHAGLGYRHFSAIDEENQITVLDYVTTLLRKPVAKREIVIEDLALLIKNRWTEQDLENGSVSLITDVPVTEARILETIYGGFCYSIVIDDEGWHKQEIHYRTRGILSGQITESKTEADIILIHTGRFLTQFDIDALSHEVETKIQPMTVLPAERFEKEAT